MKKITAILLVSILVFGPVSNITYADTLTPMPNGGVAVMHSSGCTETDYPAADDTDIDRGNALLSAVASAVNGDVLYLTSGTFDLQSSVIDESLGGTGSISIHGSGKYNTIIQSTAHGHNATPPIVLWGRNSQTTDLSILGTYGDTDYQYPFGSFFTTGGTSGSGRAYLKNAYLSGYSDGIYVATSDSTIDLIVINTTIHTKWDGVYLQEPQNRAKISIYDSDIVINGDSGLSNGDVDGIISVRGTIKAWDTNITVSGGTNFNRAVVTGNSSPGSVYLYGGNISSSGTAAIDLYRAGGDINVSPSVVYDTEKVQGSITSVSEVTKVVPTLPTEVCRNPFLPPDVTAPNNNGILNIVANSPTQLTIVANTANDTDSGLSTTPYWFNETSGNSGAMSSSDWQASTTFVNSGLSPNTIYTYQVKARDASGNASEYSSTTSKYTLASQIDNLIATDLLPSSPNIKLTWTNHGQRGIKIEQDSACDGYDSVIYDSTSTVPELPYLVSGLTKNVCYKFRISSYNHDGDINGSNIPETEQIIHKAPHSSPSGTIIYSVNKDKSETELVVRTSPSGSTLIATSTVFYRDLTLKDVGDDVKALQKYLNIKGYTVSKNGPGSLGNETTYFGLLTRNALIRFQIDSNIKPSIGYFGPITRAFIVNSK